MIMLLKRHNLSPIVLLITLLLSVSIPGWPIIQAQAQTDVPFLSSPFYGHEAINSYFDHEYPTQGAAPNLVSGICSIVKYTGDRLSNTCPQTCDINNGDCYNGHEGYDFDLSYEPVLAAADGVVVAVGWANQQYHHVSYGLRVEIEHNVNGVYYRTRYGHLSSIAVGYGQVVKTGQIIGTSGSNGNSSGPHLHFDVRVKVYEPSIQWEPIDPFGWKPTTTNDPWRYYEASDHSRKGMRSWCMWKAGEYANICNPNNPGNPIPEPAAIGEEIIIDDSDYFEFFKGTEWDHLGRDNSCYGIDPECGEWYETYGVGIGNHTFRMQGNGFQDNINIEDNWAIWQVPDLDHGLYDIYITVPQIPAAEVILPDGRKEYKFKTDTFTWQAKYKVFDCMGQVRENGIVDEYIGSYQPLPNGPWVQENNNPYNKWLNIGTYCMGPHSYVFITDVTGEAPGSQSQLVHCKDEYVERGIPDGNDGWCRMIVDAVKFVRRPGPSYLPLIYKPPTPTPAPTLTPTRTVTPIRTATLTRTPTITSTPNNNSFETAERITLDTVVYSYIYPQYDEDWYKFTVDLANECSTEINVLLSSLPADYAVELFDPSGNLRKAADDNEDTANEHISFTTNREGDWRIVVKSNSDYYNQSDSYSIRVSAPDCVILQPGGYPAP